MNYIEKVYSVVVKIPKGKVMTYGMVAKAVGIDPRMVGWALHANRSSDIPCHRVVDRTGRVALNFAFNGPEEQRRRLEPEGVGFSDEMHVDLVRYLHS